MAILLGGTNPSLVEAMAFGLNIIAFDVNFNRETLGGYGVYFKDAVDLADKVKNYESNQQEREHILDYVKEKYNWDLIAQRYFEIFQSLHTN